MYIPSFQQIMGIIGIIISHILLCYADRSAVIDVIAPQSFEIGSKCILGSFTLQGIYIGIYVSISQIPQQIPHIGGLCRPVLLLLLIKGHLPLNLLHGLCELVDYYFIFLITEITVFLNASIEKWLVRFVQHVIRIGCSLQAPLIQISQTIADTLRFFRLRHFIIDDAILHIVTDTNNPVRIIHTVFLHTAVTSCCRQCIIYR